MTATSLLVLIYAIVYGIKNNLVSMKHAPLFTALILAGLVACKTPELNLSPDLNDQAAMPVKGRNGFQIGQVISYGDFKTSKVRRGWTNGYDLPFFVRFQAAREKMSYTQYGPEGQAAQVACISKFKSVELPVVRDFFGIPLDYQNYFAGNIALSTVHWDFLLYNPNGDFLREKASAGFVQNGATRIEIQAIRGLKGQPEWMKELAVYGHEFVLDGKVVGTVSTINRGKVWINESLDANTRTVIAAVATGILLRTEVEGADMSPTK